MDVELAQALVLPEPSSAHLLLPDAALKHFESFAGDCGVARASQDAVVIPEGLERLPQEEWQPLIEWCRGVLRPDGVLVLRMARGGSMAPGVLKRTLARCFGAVDIFGWDGAWRSGTQRSASDLQGSANLFVVCRPFLPYAVRSLDLLRPRAVTDGPGWQSSWLCERPALPGRFLLRATVDVIGERPGGVELRLKFIAPGGARFRMEAHLGSMVSGRAELLLASHQAQARGDPAWADVERIALEVSSDAADPVDVRLSDVRVLFEAGSSLRPVTRTSADLREGYDESYYKAMSGYALYRERRELRERVNVHRAYALMLSRAPKRVVDIGCGRGELAQHLLDEGAEVTLLDYSPTAMEFAKRFVGDRPKARFVVNDAANLAAHVAEGSQDAIFMTDFVEHLTVDELRAVLQACRRVLAPHGSLLIHTPERFSGSIATAKAIHGLHVNLFEIDTLRALLRETFAAVNVFTWDGFECFHRRGYCIELFACARGAQDLSLTRALSPAGARAGSGVEKTWRREWVFARPQLPSSFVLDATVEAAQPDAGGRISVHFLAADERLVAQAARDLSRMQTFPAHLRLASELLAPQSQTRWETVERIVLRAVSHGGGEIEMAVSDASLRSGHCRHDHSPDTAASNPDPSIVTLPRGCSSVG